MSTDAEVEARIATLKGQINHARQQQQNAPPYQQHTQQSYYRGGYNPRGHYNSGYRFSPYGGGRGRGRGGFHNRTLVVSGTNTPTKSSDDQSAAEDDLLNALIDEPTVRQQASSDLVKTRGTHNQLMTKAAYEREQQAKLAYQNQTGQPVQSQYKPAPAVAPVTNPGPNHASRELEIEGIRFFMKEDGSKLTRSPDNPPNAPQTPKKVVVAGVEFMRTKSGNLLRTKTVSTPARSTNKPVAQCEHFIKNGVCPFGDNCRYDHNPEKVSMCKTFFHSGTCPNGDDCDLSHKPTYHRVPACTHYQNGNCTNNACRYAHVNVSPGPLICRPFALLGYCEKGVKCDKRHVVECPDYNERGQCPNHKCKLPHNRRAHVERQKTVMKTDDDSEFEDSDAEADDAGANAAAAAAADDESDDDVVMFGTDGSTDDNDLDNDRNRAPDPGLSQNQDYVPLY